VIASTGYCLGTPLPLCLEQRQKRLGSKKAKRAKKNFAGDSYCNLLKSNRGLVK